MKVNDKITFPNRVHPDSTIAYCYDNLHLVDKPQQCATIHLNNTDISSSLFHDILPGTEEDMQYSVSDTEVEDGE